MGSKRAKDEPEGEAVSDKSYPPDAVLTKEEVCEWLEIGESTFWVLPIRKFNLLPGRKRQKLVRVCAQDVYDYIEKQMEKVS